MAPRRLRADEWARWREFRLAMLQDSPMSFGSTYAEVVGHGEDEWRSRARDMATLEHTTYVVVTDDRDEWLAGAGGYVDDDGLPNVFGVWTRPDARGQRHAEACVRAVVEWARGTGAPEVRLWATDTNTAARRVYDRLGFTPTGTTGPLPHTPSVTESEYALRLETRT